MLSPTGGLDQRHRDPSGECRRSSGGDDLPHPTQRPSPPRQQVLAGYGVPCLGRSGECRNSGGWPAHVLLGRRARQSLIHLLCVQYPLARGQPVLKGRVPLEAPPALVTRPLLPWACSMLPYRPGDVYAQHLRAPSGGCRSSSGGDALPRRTKSLSPPRQQAPAGCGVPCLGRSGRCRNSDGWRVRIKTRRQGRQITQCAQQSPLPRQSGRAAHLQAARLQTPP
jgi:hypothetical protein